MLLNWGIWSGSMLRTFGCLRRGVIFGSEEGRFLAILLWIVGTGFNSHLRIHHFPQLMNCSWRKERRICWWFPIPPVIKFYPFFKEILLCMRKVKRCNLLVIICVVSSRAAKSCTLVWHSMYPLLSSASQIKKNFFQHCWFIICINCVNMIRN